MDDQADALLQLIETAFHAVPRGPLSMHQAHIAKWADEQRITAAAALDHDVHWSEIPDATIEQAKNALYGADPISWRYFLPAYMSWTIRHFRTSDSFICDQTIYAFAVHNVSDPLRQESILRFDTLNTVQKRCVCAFLRHMACFPDHCDADAARQYLGKYWEQFFPGLHPGSR